jgi:hypothetical protein
MIRTGVIAKEKLKRGQNSKICPKTGAVRSVVPAPKVLSAWVENKTRPYSAKQRRITDLKKTKRPDGYDRQGVFKLWCPNQGSVLTSAPAGAGLRACLTRATTEGLPPQKKTDNKIEPSNHYNIFHFPEFIDSFLDTKMSLRNCLFFCIITILPIKPAPANTQLNSCYY